MITQEEFIEKYMRLSNLPVMHRTPQGLMTAGGGYISLPCYHCDYEGCEGWAMMPDSLTTVLLHCNLHLPDVLPRLHPHLRLKQRATGANGFLHLKYVDILGLKA